MRFKKNRRYRHISCLDIDIEVIREVFHDNRRSVLKVFILNRNYDNGNFVIDTDKIKIYKEQYKFWREL